MSWIKWTRGLARKPEVLAMASALQLDRHHVSGLLMAVWEWVDENVTQESRGDRDTDSATLRVGPQAVQLLDSLVGVQGFADAMASVGWLHVRTDHVAFPNFFRHNGQSAKERALAANRQSRKRHADVTPPSRSGRDQRREEKKREEERENQPPNPPQAGGHNSQPPTRPRTKKPPQNPEAIPIPPALDSPAFRQTWADWLADRKARGKPVTELAAKQQLADLSSLTPENAMECVKASIRNGWAGLFPDKYRGTNQAPQPAGSRADFWERKKAEAINGGTQ